MRNSIKAALFSALVFPGSGHLVLRKYLRGALLAVVSAVCLYVLTTAVLEIAMQISDEIFSGQIPLDSMRITEEVMIRSAQIDPRAVGISTWLLIACWLVGIADSFREGWLQDKRENTRRDTPQD